MHPPVPNETKELMLESLNQIAMWPSFMVDCWANYDCGTDSEDMFERLMAFLTRVSRALWYRMSILTIQGVYPPGPPKADGSSSLFEGLDNVQLLSLEALLDFVSSMNRRLEQVSASRRS
jgi:brefeldin A-resistance guanine nucleotide exchange factor 1